MPVGPQDLGVGRLFGASRDAVIAADSGTGRIVLWNPAAERIFGYPLEEALGMEVEALAPEESRERLGRILGRYARRGTPVEPGEPLELPALRRDGSRLYVELALSIVEEPRGGPPFVLAIARDVTERVGNDRSLRAHRALLNAQSEGSPDGILVVSREGRILSYNSRFARMWGIPEEVLASGSNEEALAAVSEKLEDLDGFRRRLEYLYSHPEDESRDEIRLRDGRVFERYGVMIRDAEAGLEGRVWYYRDITGRKEAEGRLRRAEARYRTLVERMPAVTYVQEIGGPEPALYMSPQIEDLTGYSPEECRDPSLRWSLVHPEDRERLRAEDEREAEAGEVVATEYRVVHREGREVWVRNESVVVEEPDGSRYWQGFIVDITERKRAEEAARRGEEHFRSLVQNSSDIITLTDSDGDTVRYASPAVEGVLGYRPEERVGRSVFELLHPEDVEGVRRVRERVLAEPGVPVDHEARMRHRDGSWRVIEATVTNRIDEPSVGGIVLNWRDVTKRRRAEEALRRSEEHYRLVALATNEAIWDADIPADRQTWDGAFEATFGYPQDLATDEAWWREHIHPEDRDGVIERTEAVLAGGGDTWTEEYRFRRADGEYAVVVDRAIVVRDGEGRAVRMIGSMMDVTERRRAEEEIRHLNESLERQIEERTAELREALEKAHSSEERLGLNMARFRSLLRNASDAIMVLDAGGMVRFTTLTSSRGLGYSSQKMLGTNVFDLVHPEDRARVEETFRKTLERTGTVNHEEVRALHADGTWREMEVVYTNLLHDPSVGGVVVNSRDVTQRKRAERRLWAHYSVTRALEESASFQEAADEVLRALCEGLGWEVGSAFFRHRRRGKLRCYRTWHAPSLEVPRYEELTWDDFDYTEDTIGRVWASGEADWIPDIEREGGSLRREAALGEGMRSAVAVPILVQGRSVGVLEFLGCERREPEPETLEMMNTVGAQIGQFIERRRAQEELRESEERLRSTFDQAAVGVGHCDLEGRYVAANQTLCEMLGYTRREMLGKPYPELTLASEMATDQELTRQLFAGERSTYVREKPMLRKDGVVIWTHHAVSLVRDPAGRPREFVGVIQDVTERRRMEEARRQSESLYRAVVEQAAENIFIVDVETKRIIEANPALQRSLGYTETELKRMTLYDIVDHDRKSVDTNIGRIVSRRGYTVGERRYRRKDGSLVYVEVNVGLVTHRRRQAMCVVAHDITERKAAENNFRHSLGVLLALYEAGQVLTSSLDLEQIAPSLLDIMRRVANLSAAVIYLRDASGEMRARYARGAEEVWSSASETPVARRARATATEGNEPVPFDLPEVRRDRLPQASCGLCLPLRVMDRPVGVLEVYGAEFLRERTTVEVLTSLASQAGSALENARLYGEAAARERRLEELVGKLISAQEEERRRVSYEVHDGLAQVAASAHQRLQAYAWRHPPQDEGAREDLGRVLELVRRTVGEARKVIADLRPTVLDDFGLAAALNQKVEELRDEGWSVDYEESLGEERLPVAVETALYRVAQEALTNARKHANSEGASLTLRREDGTVTLRVQDSGRGFDPARLESASGPGERVGLSGMSERVSMIGGEIEVKSAIGKGTCVTVRVEVPSTVSERQTRGITGGIRHGNW